MGADVRDRDGDKIGTVGQVYVDEVNGNPRWVSVRTGLFGLSESFVPLDQANWEGNDVRVPYEKKFVKDAPRIDIEASQALTVAEELELYRHYKLDYAQSGDTSGRKDIRSGKRTDDAMTRSEEQVRVGKEHVQTGRVRLHTYVVTEQQNVTVPVSHEEVRSAADIRKEKIDEDSDRTADREQEGRRDTD